MLSQAIVFNPTVAAEGSKILGAITNTLSISASVLFSLSAKSGGPCPPPITHTLPTALPQIWNFYLCILANKISQILFIHCCPCTIRGPIKFVYHKMISADNRNNKMASENSDRIISLGERQFVFPSENLKSLKDHGSYFR